jgi:murein DD-endopeptidase MepM/ murein hydrolase activator NlpD
VVGDSLARISKAYDIPRNALEEQNEAVLEEGLRVGQKLYLPFEANPQWNAEYGEFPERELASEPATTSSFSRVAFLWPVSGRVSSKFGRRYMRGRGQHFHEGIDIAARKGTPVQASRSGHVVYATNRIRGYGNMVIVQHADSFSTVYAHLTKIQVRKGQFVTRGQSVGTVGRTGRSTGHHLHFEVRTRRQPVDPMPLLFERFARNL